jgi:hypothetical protein
MQALMNKQEKEQLVIALHQEGKTIRGIAQQAHMSFKDIGAIIKRIDGRDDDKDDPNLSNKSKSTKALYLLERGKRPIDVAIELDLSALEVHDIQEEFWFLNDHYDLVFVYAEIKNYLPSFMKLFRLLRQSKMLSEDHILRFIKYSGHDLPLLENKFQKLSGDVIDLQWKKRQYQDELAILGSAISQQRHSLNVIIDYKKQILACCDEKINEKLAPTHSDSNYKDKHAA